MLYQNFWRIMNFGSQETTEMVWKSNRIMKIVGEIQNVNDVILDTKIVVSTKENIEINI